MSGPPPPVEGTGQQPHAPAPEPVGIQQSGSTLSAPPGAGDPGQQSQGTSAPAGLEDQTGTAGTLSNVTPAQEAIQPAEVTHHEETAQHPSTTTAPESAQPAVAPAPPGQPIQPEGDISIDTDSAYGDDGVSVYTASLTSSVVDFPVENGRRYHAFRDGTYVFPNDEPEQERMDLQHEMYKRAVSHKLHIAPLPADMKEKRILDLGTGTGIWCIEMADQYPDAEVVGNDFSPVQPRFVPRNVKFEVDDIESPWTHTQPFDYIHSRFMAGSIADWPALVRRCYENVRPGGIVEFQDGDFVTYSEDGSTKGTWLEKWNLQFADAASTGGRIVQPGLFLEQWFREAGFEDVHHEKVRLPLGLWPKDRQMKEVGAFNLVQLREGLEGFSLRLFTGVLGWTADEVQVLLSKVRSDLDNRNIHSQNDMHIVWGRKPAF